MCVLLLKRLQQIAQTVSLTLMLVYIVSGEEPCSKILVHGSHKYSAVMGVYSLDPVKIDGFVGYSLPSYEDRQFAIYAAADKWVFRAIAQGRSLGDIDRNEEEFPYNATGVWGLKEYWWDSETDEYPEFKVECIDTSLFVRVGICEDNIIEEHADTSYKVTAEECKDICFSLPECVAFSTSRYGCSPHRKQCLELSSPEGLGFYVVKGKYSYLLDNKSVYQSSTDAEWNGYAEKAVDGIYSSNLVEGLSCSLTQQETNAWWAADLEKSYFLKAMVILPRFDCCSRTFGGVTIGGETTSDASATLSRLAAKDFSLIKTCLKISVYTSPTNGPELVYCVMPVLIHTFIIYKHSNDGAPLSICEIELLTEEAGRYSFYDVPVPADNADEICFESFGDGRLVEISSEEEYQALERYVQQNNIVGNMRIGDKTSPASRGIGLHTLYEHGEAPVNAASVSLAASCSESTSQINATCINVFVADDTAWSPENPVVNEWIKISFRYYYHVYKVILKQHFETRKAYKSLQLEFSEGETFEMMIDATGQHFDVMDFSGFLSDSMKITITSIHHTDTNGFNNILVYSKLRGVRAYPGSCDDEVSSYHEMNIGECEMACLKNLSCLSFTHELVGNQKLCKLRTGPCLTIKPASDSTVLRILDESHGYNVLNLTAGCDGGYDQFITAWSSTTLSQCMDYCDGLPECDNFGYCEAGNCAGFCYLYTGSCEEDTDRISLRYQRRGGLYQRADNTYAGCFPLGAWHYENHTLELYGMSSDMCSSFCSITNHTFYALLPNDMCSCGSVIYDAELEARVCSNTCSGSDDNEVCGGWDWDTYIDYVSLHLQKPSTPCLVATTEVPYTDADKNKNVFMEFKEELCEKPLPFVCMRDADYCSNTPCENGGTCVATALDFSCTCAAGFTGYRCETDIDDCAQASCAEGATCTDLINDFACICATGFTDKLCDKDIDDCETDPCLNGGTCVDEISYFTCDCPVAYTGINCETDIDECSNWPCGLFGKCVDHVGSYTCECHEGFIGSHCQTEINECESQPCLNGGTCHDNVNSYFCQCLPGIYEGLHCEFEIDNCDAFLCKNNGTCKSAIDGYSCTCAPGFTGFGCESDIDECSSSPCKNGGSCQDGVNGFECDCSSFFTGEYCSHYVSKATWESWGTWSECSVTCGSGTRHRYRLCSSQLGPGDCPGEDSDVDDCDTGPCGRVDGKWGKWKTLTECPDTCGLSTQLIFRECDTPQPQHGGSPCSGPNEATLSCFTYCNEVSQTCGDWEDWSICEGSCGSGTQSRTRDCSYNTTDPVVNHIYTDEDTRDCTLSGCPNVGLQCYSCEYNFDGSHLGPACSDSTKCGGGKDQCVFEYNPGTDGSVTAKTRCGSSAECDTLDPDTPCSSLLFLGKSASEEDMIAALNNLNDSCSVCCNSHLCNKGWHIESSPYLKISNGPNLSQSVLLVFALQLTLFIGK